MCLCCTQLLPSPYTPLSASKKQRKQQSAVVDSNRAYKQHHKSSLQTSNSIQLRFGLSHLHLTQVRQASAVQTTNRQGSRGDCGCLSENNFFSHSQLCSASLSLHNSCCFLLPPTQPKKITRTGEHSFNQIILSLHHNYAALQSLLLSLRVVSIFTAFTTV